MTPRMDLFDKLPVEVRQAINDALSPISVEYIYSMMIAGAPTQQLLEVIDDIDAEQHRGARLARLKMFGRITTDGVVPSAPDGFKVNALKTTRKIR